MALDSILSTPVIPPPPKSSVSSSSSSSSASGSSSPFGVSGSSDCASASQQSSGSHHDNDGGGNGSEANNTTRSSGKNASSRSNSSSGSQAQSSSKSSRSEQGNATNQTQSTHNAANGKNGAAQSAKNPGPTFLQTLAAQSQTDAQDSATAVTAGVQPVVTGKGKGKTAKDDGSAANSAASFGFLSQSLVAAMAGIQQQQPAPPAQGSADNDGSVDGVSLSSGTTAQSLVTSLMQNTADELKAAAGDGAKTDSASANTTPAPDVSTAASAFQAHLGVSSQSQTQASQQAANTQVNTPVGASGFADEVGDKITWMAHQGVQSASLQMTPEHMGPVEVKISVQAGSATVSINAAHADTRAALEQALPRLREMFSTQGMNLTDASVSQQFSREQPQKRGVSAIGAVGSVSDEGSSAVVSVTSARLGLVDTYA